MSSFVQTSNFTHFACLIHSTLESNVYWSLTFSDDFNSPLFYLTLEPGSRNIGKL